MLAKNYIKRTIAAAHYLPGYDGPCSNVHGHTWVVEVWLIGEINVETGMVVDFKTIKNIIDHYDHTFLNEEKPFLHETLSPTAENLAGVLCTRIRSLLKAEAEVCVRVWESRDCYSEVQNDYC